MTLESSLLPAAASTRSRLARVSLLMSTVALVAACGGGGGGDDSSPPPPPPPPAAGPFTITGQASFESIPADADGVGLNYAGAVDKPVRGATVQLLSGSTVLATTTTDAAGNYSVVLPTSQAVTIRVRAEILRAGAANGDRDFKVLDNTNGDAIYVLDSASFTPVANTTQNVRADSGWGGSSYNAPRAAGPFAILDVAYDAQAKVETAAPTVDLPPLNIFWSVNNKPSATFNRTTGDIVTSFFRATSPRELYILGAANTDTDEYDTHVVAHEVGHYLQSAVSRDDSVGGPHGGGDKLDARVAFSEGWGNAWSGIALNDPRYTDSLGTNQASGFFFNVNTPPSLANKGWFSEASAQFLIWSANATAGFTPIYNALVAMATTPAWSTLYSFAQSVKAAAPGSAAAIDALWVGEQIFGTGIYGAGETNGGGITGTLPVYKTHTAALGAAQNYCVNATADPDNDGNKLGEYVYITFGFTGVRTIVATRTSGVSPTDPDFSLLRSDGTVVDAFSGVADSETLAGVNLPAGTHTIALSDFNITSGNTSCFNVTVN